MSDIYIGDRIKDIANAIRETSPCKHQWSEMLRDASPFGATIYYQKCKFCGLINVIFVKE